jgi:hypothetical protein
MDLNYLPGNRLDEYKEMLHPALQQRCLFSLHNARMKLETSAVRKLVNMPYRETDDEFGGKDFLFFLSVHKNGKS